MFIEEHVKRMMKHVVVSRNEDPQIMDLPLTIKTIHKIQKWGTSFYDIYIYIYIYIFMDFTMFHLHR